MAEMKFIRVPPDSTGKRVTHGLTIHLLYNGGTQDFEVGDTVIGENSGAIGEVGLVQEGSTTEQGALHVIMALESPDSFSQNENIIVNGTTYAQVASQIPVYSQHVQMVGGNNTTHTVAVDEKGAMFTRAAEGSHQFDAFGKLEVSQRTTIGEYTFNYDRQDEYIEYEELGSGVVTHQPDYSGILFTCGSNTGDVARGTSHLYHKYQPSIGQVFQATVSMGDEGKDNLIRRWGYFDQKDGMFFELNGSDLSVVIRSSATGTVAETRILQKDWNVDRLNGEGGTFNLSGENLDITKINIWWIDFQWLGAGRIRFGIVIDGVRITIHSQTGNISHLPYTSTGTLPVRFCQENVGSVTSSSQMRVVCCTVGCEGDFKPQHIGFSPQFDTPPIAVNSFTEKPLFSARSKVEFKGKENRAVILARTLTGIVTGAPIAIRIYKNATLTGDLWVLDPGPSSSGELDGNATAVTGGRLLWSKILAPNESIEQDISYLFNYEQGETIKRHANIAEYDTYTLTARLIDPDDPPAKVSITLNWLEIQ